MKKHTTTPFARMILFLLFFVPATYIGVAYYNGEDGIEKAKSLFRNSNDDTVEAQIKRLENEISTIESKLEAKKEALRILQSKSEN